MELKRKQGFYEKYIKRLLDILCSLVTIAVFWWLYLIIALLVKIKLGSPVIFKQPRPGMVDPATGRETIFYMIKFRTMTNERDQNGELLPDEQRLTNFGRFLRATSLDEIPEVFNVLRSDMSIIGPRPQLVRDMVFMTDKQRMRHTAKPGISGLAQTHGRNAISWDEKLTWDLKYIERVSFISDLKLVLRTAGQVFVRKKDDINAAETDLELDYGDVLLNEGRITETYYKKKQAEARELLMELDKERKI